MAQIRRVAEAGADIVRCAVPREQDVEALKTIVGESPIPVIADIHFNHTLALKAIDAGAHCVRLNPGNIGGPDKVAEVAARASGRHADADRRQLRLAAQAPARARARELRRGARHGRGRVRRADGAARLRRTSRSRSSRRTCRTRSPPTACSSRADPVPAAPRHHRGRHEVVGLAQVAPSAWARCSPTGSATRSASRSPPSTPRRR